MRVSAPLYALEQFACALSLLTALGMAAGLNRRSPPRLIITALLDAAAALFAAMLLPRSWQLLLLAPLGGFSPLLAWPGLPRALGGRLALISLLLSLAVAGGLRFLGAAPLPGSAAVLLLCCLFPVLSRAFHRQNSVRCAAVEILHGPGKVSLTALVDTGNLLRDPITALPVIVVSRRAAQRLIPLGPPGDLPPGMRLIAVRTVGGTSLMPVFHPQLIHLMQDGVWRRVNAMVGLSPDGYDGAQALVPACLIHQDAASAPIPIT